MKGIARHLPYHSPGLPLDHVLDRENGTCHFRYSLSIADRSQRQIVELSYGVAYRFLQTVAGERRTGWEVRWRHARAMPGRVYARYFDCPLRFGQPHDEILLPLAVLDRVIDTDRGGLAAAAERFVRHTMRRFPLDIGRQVEEYIGLRSVPLHQLAALLGYTSAVSLHRSCMRWFGQPPSALRAGRPALQRQRSITSG